MCMPPPPCGCRRPARARQRRLAGQPGEAAGTGAAWRGGEETGAVEAGRPPGATWAGTQLCLHAYLSRPQPLLRSPQNPPSPSGSSCSSTPTPRFPFYPGQAPPSPLQPLSRARVRTGFNTASSLPSGLLSSSPSFARPPRRRPRTPGLGRSLATFGPHAHVPTRLRTERLLTTRRLARADDPPRPSRRRRRRGPAGGPALARPLAHPFAGQRRRWMAQASTPPCLDRRDAQRRPSSPEPPPPPGHVGPVDAETLGAARHVQLAAPAARLAASRRRRR